MTNETPESSQKQPPAEAVRSSCVAPDEDEMERLIGTPMCCANESRDMRGGCRNCGDPCL